MAADTFTLQIDLIDGTQQVITLTDKPVVVGTSRSNEVRLKADYISRRHFQVELVGGRVYVTDLGSQNGTYLNGQRLEPGRRQAWLPGDMLAIANTVRATILGRMTAPPAQPVGQIQLAVEPKTLRPNQPALLTLTYPGGQSEQQVYFRAYSFVEGVEFELQPREHFVPPGGTVNVRARAFPVKTFLLGGIVPVSFSAMTADGLFAKADATLRLRPRLELLLLALLLLCPATVAGAAALQRVISIALAPTATPTFTPEPTALPTLTPTALPSETPTPEPTATPTLTPFPTATSCFNQCAALGWPSYLVREGDTLSSLAAAGNVSVARAAQVNCLVDPSRIQVGQRICLPVIPTVTTPAPACAGFRPTSPFAFPLGPIDFYWDPPTAFRPTSYRVTVYNAENGASLVSREVPGTTTTVRLDVSQGAIGGNFRFDWTVEALLNGAAVCSGRTSVFREAPTAVPTQNRPPVVTILVPQSNCAFDSLACRSNGMDFYREGSPYYLDLDLLGQAVDPEDGPLTGTALEWRTDQPALNGIYPASTFLGDGASIAARLFLATENCGVNRRTHTITLTARDSAGATASATRSIEVWYVVDCDDNSNDNSSIAF